MSKQYLISEELTARVIDEAFAEAGLDLGTLRQLQSLPEAKTPDLDKLERLECRQDDGMVSSNHGDGDMGEGPYVRYSDLANLVHSPTGPDATPLVEALEQAIKFAYEDDFTPDMATILKWEAAISAYRGGSHE